MKKNVLLGIIAIGMSSSAAADNIIPYVGIDAKWSQMKFNKVAGDNLVQKKYPQGNLFGGVKFNEWAAFEIGFESTQQRKKNATVSQHGNFFGLFNPDEEPFIVNTKTKIAGFHANVVGTYLIEGYDLNLFGSIGLARLKLRTHLEFIAMADPGVLNSRDFVKRKVVPRLTLGVQRMLNENLGLRAMLTWERTSAFKNIYASGGSSLYMRPKNSKSVGLGVFYSFN